MKKNRGHFSDILSDFENEIPISLTKKTERRMHIAAVLDDILKEKGWSKMKFSEEVKQQPSVISKWLSGTHNFTIDTLEDIGIAFKMDIFSRIAKFTLKESDEWIIISKIIASQVGTYDIESACMHLTLSTIGKSKSTQTNSFYKKTELLS